METIQNTMMNLTICFLCRCTYVYCTCGFSGTPATCDSAYFGWLGRLNCTSFSALVILRSARTVFLMSTSRYSKAFLTSFGIGSCFSSCSVLS